MGAVLKQRRLPITSELLLMPVQWLLQGVPVSGKGMHDEDVR